MLHSGLFPEMKDYYCLQIIFDDRDALRSVEEFLKGCADIVKDGEVPVKKAS